MIGIVLLHCLQRAVCKKVTPDSNQAVFLITSLLITVAVVWHYDGVGLFGVNKQRSRREGTLLR